MSQERLQKILARAGVSSRRAAEELITGGHVQVNGKLVTELGTRADPEVDRIDVDGRPIMRERHVYYLLHKPRSIVTTLKDPEGRPSLDELLHDIPERVYPVGRLDFHTSGALLLTNDGDLAQALLHPSRAVPKTYVAKLSREVDDYMLNALESGVVLDDGYRTQPAQVEHLRDEDGKSWLQITITEGKNRQIHRMIETLDTRVMRLSRLSFAGLSTEGLRPGQLRPLSREELYALRRQYLPGAVEREERAERGRGDVRGERAHGERAARGQGDRRTERGRDGQRSEPERGARERPRAGQRADSGGSRERRESDARGQRAAKRNFDEQPPRSARSQNEKAATRVDRDSRPRHKSRPT